MLSDWYYSAEWKKFREIVKQERIARDGELICDYCHKSILKPYDAICHHVKPLTEGNYTNPEISLNPENIQVVHHACHEAVHAALNLPWRRTVYLVWGAPKSGKSYYVDSVRQDGDLILDIARVYEAVGGKIGDRRLSPIVFKLCDAIIDMIKVRYGKWNTAYVIGTYPYESDRRRLIETLNAEEIFIDTEEGTCLSRCNSQEEMNYVREWFSAQG